MEKINCLRCNFRHTDNGNCTAVGGFCADDMTPCVELVGGRVTFTEKFGKTVFLSREEAEKALQEMEGKKDGNETSM